MIAAVKLRWPNAVDGTALCIGAAAPDIAYPLGSWLNDHSHTATGLVVWAIPFTLIITTLVRWRAASGIFAAFPDLGRLRLRSYRVLGTRRPARIVTLLSATLGAASHVVVDGFTHTGRFGSNWLNMNATLFSLPVRGDFSIARVLQYVGHVGGSVAFAVILLIIANSGRLERWYGSNAVDAARSVTATQRQRIVFWVIVTVPTIAALVVARATDRAIIFLPLTALVLGVVTAGIVIGLQLEPAPTEPTPASGLAAIDE